MAEGSAQAARLRVVHEHPAMTVSWAVITGATRGIGWSVARRLSQDGFSIVATGRDAAALSALSAEIAKGGGDVRTAVVDLADPQDVEDFAAGLSADGICIGALINNAGYVEVFKYAQTPKVAWDQILQVNLHAPLELIRRLHGQMPAGSSIVNVGSILGIRASKSVTPYVISKGALHHATKVLALELSEYGIRVNAVAPGFIATEMFEHGHTEANKLRIAEAHPLGRVGRSDEIAGAVSFLCSEDASFITGVVLPVDGGLSATMIIPDLGGAT